MSRHAIAEAVAAFDAVARERAWRYYVFGAQAVLIYGRPRMTVDVDLAVDVGDATARVVVEHLSAGGIELRIGDYLERSEAPRLLPLFHQPTNVPIDLVLASGGIDQDFLSRTVRRDIGGGVMAPILAIGDLLATKLLAGRRKDMEDVRGILAVSGDAIDREGLLEVLRRVDEALDEPRVVRALERLMARRKG